MTYNESPSGSIESLEDFDKTPRGQYDYWSEELLASKKARSSWHKSGDAIVKRFLDHRKGTHMAGLEGLVDTSAHNIPFRLNLFHSNVTTLTSMLYGNLPTVDVSRRYADPNDDVSRVAAEMMERLLNSDIAENGEEINAVLRSTLQDRLLPGLGCARVRYEVEIEETEVEISRIGEDGLEQIMTETEEKVISEDAPIDYFFWRDVLWGWGRNWAEIPWIAYRVWMTKDEVSERFGEEIADKLQYRKQLVTGNDDTAEDPILANVWMKAEIWEIWDKTSRKVIFVSTGAYHEVLDTKKDPLQLRGFYPSPPFFLANATTTLYQPVPDYQLAQDLYNQIDLLQTRIAIITQAVKVVGVYDSSADGIQRMFKEGIDNDLIPVENWALFGEKGGIQGQVDWLPLADIVNALDKLRELRDETIDLLYQVTGMADVLRGGGAGQYEGVGQAQLKAKFGSVRIQALQDEFAVFASNLMQIKAEIISLHFNPETIVQRSNIDQSFDRELVPKALELIKNPKLARMKVEIRPESVAMVDYAQLKQERTDYITALATFMQSAAPLIEQDPNSKPFLLQLLQWGLAGFKGSSEIEGVIDRAISASEMASQQGDDKPDPAKQAAQIQMQLEQMKQQGELEKIQAKASADAEARKIDMDADIRTSMAQHNAKMAEIEADMRAKIAETQAKMQADILVERAQAESNILQTESSANAEIQKDVASTTLEIEKEAVKTELKINEIAASTTAKINEATVKEETSDAI